MNKLLANKIYSEIEAEWTKKYGKENLDTKKLRAIKEMLKHIPDEDGNKRVTDMMTGKTHLVPVKDIIMKGLRGDCLKEYPEESNKVTIEDAMEFARESKTYREVLAHRRKCEKWGKSFCLECFGGGLTTFTKNLNEEKASQSKKDKKERDDYEKMLNTQPEGF